MSLRARAGASRRLTFCPSTAATGIQGAAFPSIVMRPEIDPVGFGFEFAACALTSVDAASRRVAVKEMRALNVFWPAMRTPYFEMRLQPVCARIMSPACHARKEKLLH